MSARDQILAAIRRSLGVTGNEAPRRRAVADRLAGRPRGIIPARAVALIARRKGRLGWLPFATGWTRHREFPAPQGATFQSQWKARQAARPGSR